MKLPSLFIIIPSVVQGGLPQFEQPDNRHLFGQLQPGTGTGTSCDQPNQESVTKGHR